MVSPERLKPKAPLSQVKRSTTGCLYRYYTAILVTVYPRGMRCPGLI